MFQPGAAQAPGFGAPGQAGAPGFLGTTPGYGDAAVQAVRSCAPHEAMQQFSLG